MRKILSVIIALLMLLTPAMASENEEAARLSVGEIDIYISRVLSEAAAGEHSLEANGDAEGAKVAFAGGTLTIAEDALSENAVVYAYDIAPGHLCPRGLMVGDSLNTLMTLYPLDNVNLLGDYNSALMYLSGTAEEGVEYGLVTRDGQRIQEIRHCAIETSPDGATAVTVDYSVTNGIITGITVSGLNRLIPEEEVIAEVNALADLQEKRDYFAYPTSENGAELDMFMREDLQFSDLDFLDLTPESAMTVLGAAQSDTWMPDSTGENLRFMQWDGIEIIFRYDANKEFISAHTFSMKDDIFDGPRGVRVGDTYFSVRERFMFGQGEITENTTFLYGDGLTPPYATQLTSQSTAVLTYVLEEGGRTIAFYITFDINWIVQSFMIYDL